MSDVFKLLVACVCLMIAVVQTHNGHWDRAGCFISLACYLSIMADGA